MRTPSQHTWLAVHGLTHLHDLLLQSLDTLLHALHVIGCSALAQLLHATLDGGLQARKQGQHSHCICCDWKQMAELLHPALDGGGTGGGRQHTTVAKECQAAFTLLPTAAGRAHSPFQQLLDWLPHTLHT